MTTQSLPELQGTGFCGGYRVYTIDHLPFDALPNYDRGGPAKVAVDGWGVSYTLGRGNAEFHAYRVPYTGAKHELDGTTYSTIEDAQHAAYDAGLIAFMVYEEDAERYGLTANA